MMRDLCVGSPQANRHDVRATDAESDSGQARQHHPHQLLFHRRSAHGMPCTHGAQQPQAARRPGTARQHIGPTSVGPPRNKSGSITTSVARLVAGRPRHHGSLVVVRQVVHAEKFRRQLFRSFCRSWRRHHLDVADGRLFRQSLGLLSDGSNRGPRGGLAPSVG